MVKKYKIIRIFRKQGRECELIRTGLSRGQAQDHCRRDDTHEKGVWFDGYAEE